MHKRVFGALVVLVLVMGLAVGPVPASVVEEIELMTTTEGYDPIRYEAGYMIAEAWEELGFKVRVRPMEFSTILQLFYEEHDFDATILGWSGRVERLDPQMFLSTMHSGQTDLGGNNPGGYVNPVYDALFEAQQQEFDVDKRRELVHKAQEIGMGDQPFNVIFYRDEVVAYNNETFGNFVAMAGESLYNEWTPYHIQPLQDSTTLTIGTPQEPDNINPLESTSVWGWKFMRMYYDKLIRLSPDIEPKPWAAESFEAVDETTVRIVLREGMTFHDGEPVTVDDVKFTFDYYREKQFPYFRPFYEVIDEVTIEDERVVYFHLEEPYSPFITVTLSQIPILPKHIWSEIDEPTELTPDEVPTVGSGPFVFDRYDRGEYKKLVTFNDHFRADELDIEAIDYIIYADSEGVFTGLLRGEIDMTAWRMEPGQIPLAQDEDHLTVVSVPDFGYYHITYNLRRDPFGDVELRRALAHAIDKETIINVLLDGLGEPGTSVIAPVNAFWHNPNAPTFEYDLDKAREILEEAGYWWDDDGRINYP